jgi:hypothetical protein
MAIADSNDVVVKKRLGEGVKTQRLSKRLQFAIIFTGRKRLRIAHFEQSTFNICLCRIISLHCGGADLPIRFGIRHDLKSRRQTIIAVSEYALRARQTGITTGAFVALGTLVPVMPPDNITMCFSSLPIGGPF